MFGVGAGEVIALVIIGVLLFGPDKLPDLARKVARVVHYLRNVANNAQTTIRTELGPGYEDFDIRDPKAFIRRHLLDEMDPIVADVKRELDESAAAMRQATDELRRETSRTPHRSTPATAPKAQALEAAPVGPVPFDTEAT